MDDRDGLLARIARLEVLVAEQAAKIDEQARVIAAQTKTIAAQTKTIAKQTKTIAAQTKTIAEQTKTIAEQTARIKELEAELRRRGKKFTPKANAKPAPPKTDRRTKAFRKHPGQTRPVPSRTDEIIEHDVTVDECPDCGGTMTRTGKYTEHLVEDIPEPKIEVHRYRRHVCRCEKCGATAQGRSDLAAPGAHVGERAKLLTVYGRAHLGISLGKTVDLMHELFDLRLSTAAASGHLKWFSKHFHPVVQQLLALLRESPVVHADETGWRINGKNVWCWCFSNPKLAVFLIEQRRNAAVVREALGDSLPGVLVTDFYASYHAIKCRKQRCLVHLLRELSKLREELSPAMVGRHIRPLIELFQEAIAVGHRRDELPAEEYARQVNEIKRRFQDRWWRQSKDRDCQRIYNRLRRHRNELLLFLDDPAVPSDNTPAERDIRSVAAARSDGGTNRTDWGAQAFGVAKSVIRTCRKNGVNFFGYALMAIADITNGQTPPLPLADSS